MHLLLAGLLSMALSNQIFKMSNPYCPYNLTIHTEISTRSIISCVIYCYRNKNGCSIFVYEEFQDVCTMLLQGKKAWKMKYVAQLLDVVQSSHKGIY